jgi:hypothetical protein
MVAIVGLMRFSVVTETHKKGYAATRDKSVEDALATILDPARIENRLRLVETMPLASLSAQTDPDFTLQMLISTELQPEYKARLYALLERLPYLRITEIGLQDNVRDRMGDLIVDGEPTVTFRLDDDDAVGAHHIEDLRALAVPENEGCFLSNPKGLYVQPEGDHLAVQEVTYVQNAFGIGYFSSIGESVFHKGKHNVSTVRVATGDRPRAWVRSIHAASDSREQFMAGSPSIPLVPASYPEFSFIDFESLKANLAPIKKASFLKRAVGKARKVVSSR